MSVDLTRQLRKISPLGQDIYSNSYDVGMLESMRSARLLLCSI